jgi:predicted nucleotidyltransferase
MSNNAQKWALLLKPYLTDYSISFTEMELSKKTLIPRQTVSRILKKLIFLNLFESKTIGRNKSLFFPNNQNSRMLIESLENLNSLDFNLEHYSLIEDLISCSETLVVFGSYAKGIQKSSSDLDLVFIGKSNKLEIQKIKKRLPIVVNECYFSYPEFSKILIEKNKLALEIKKNHLIFGNVSKLVDLFWRCSFD